jgi:hypothetical protein
MKKPLIDQEHVFDIIHPPAQPPGTRVSSFYRPHSFLSQVVAKATNNQQQQQP